MYDAFLYVIANDGVSKESAYPFFGKVSIMISRASFRVLTWYGMFLAVFTI